MATITQNPIPFFTSGIKKYKRRSNKANKHVNTTEPKVTLSKTANISQVVLSHSTGNNGSNKPPGSINTLESVGNDPKPDCSIEDFINKLLTAIPSLHEHFCSHGETGGFVRRLKEDEGTWIGHIWEHVTLEIQMLAGVNVSFGRTRGNGKLGQYNLVFEYKQEDVKDVVYVP